MPDWTLTLCLSFCSKVRHHTRCRGWFSSDGGWLRSNTCSLRQKITITRIVILFSLGVGGGCKSSLRLQKKCQYNRENVAKWNISTRPFVFRIFLRCDSKVVYTSWSCLYMDNVQQEKKTIVFGYSITFSIYFLWNALFDFVKKKYDFNLLKKNIYLPFL